MLVYKWVHKRDGKYYSIMNFGFTNLSNDFKTNQPPYEIGKTYDNIEEEYNNLTQQVKKKWGHVPRYIKKGFYFWVNKNKKPNYVQAKKMRELGGEINAILECYIALEDILSYERGKTCVRAKRMKVVKEI